MPARSARSVRSPSAASMPEVAVDGGQAHARQAPAHLPVDGRADGCASVARTVSRISRRGSRESLAARAERGGGRLVPPVLLGNHSQQAARIVLAAPWACQCDGERQRGGARRSGSRGRSPRRDQARRRWRAAAKSMIWAGPTAGPQGGQDQVGALLEVGGVVVDRTAEPPQRGDDLAGREAQAPPEREQAKPARERARRVRRPLGGSRRGQIVDVGHRARGAHRSPRSSISAETWRQVPASTSSSLASAR